MQMLNYWTGPNAVVIVSRNLYRSSNSLRDDERYGIYRGTEEIEIGTSRG